MAGALSVLPADRARAGAWATLLPAADGEHPLLVSLRGLVQARLVGMGVPAAEATAAAAPEHWRWYSTLKMQRGQPRGVPVMHYATWGGRRRPDFSLVELERLAGRSSLRDNPMMVLLGFLQVAHEGAFARVRQRLETAMEEVSDAAVYGELSMAYGYELAPASNHEVRQLGAYSCALRADGSPARDAEAVPRRLRWDQQPMLCSLSSVLRRRHPLPWHDAAPRSGGPQYPAGHAVGTELRRLAAVIVTEML
jgi:hypothetical protein